MIWCVFAWKIFDSYLDSPLKGKYGEFLSALELIMVVQKLIPEIRGLQCAMAVLSPVSGTSVTGVLDTITSLLLFVKK